MKKDSIGYRKVMGTNETREFMKKLWGSTKPVKIDFHGCKICGSSEVGYSKTYNKKYCKGCLTDIA